MKTADKPFALREIHTQLLRQLELFIKTHGYSPSIRELMQLMALSSTSHVRGLLGDLEANGYIRQTPGIARSIIVLERLPEDNNRPGQRSGAVGQD